MTDHELLHEYAFNGSDEAFSELVHRHINWVWSAARRQVLESSMADDVTQAVFVVLAKKAGSLSRTSRPLIPWLFKVTRYTCSEARRSQARRRHHEGRAAAMKSEIADSVTPQMWQELAPLLDELVSRLATSDRHAVLLRFYQGMSLAEVGQALGATEEGARKRVSRAVEKLRALFAQRGVSIPVAALGAAMLPNMTSAAPAATVQSVSMPTAIATTLAERTLHIMSMLKFKLAAMCLVGIASLGIGGAMITASLLQAQATTAPATAPAGAIIADDLLEVAITDLVGPGVVTRVPRRVDPEGNISLPLVQNLHLAGLNLAEAESRVSQAYRDRKLIQEATVSVTRLESGNNPSVHSRPLASLDYVRVMIGDLTAPGSSDLSTQRLTDQGDITIPLVGDVKLVGLTEFEAERTLSKAYRDKNLIKEATVWVLRIGPEEAKADTEKEKHP